MKLTVHADTHGFGRIPDRIMQVISRVMHRQTSAMANYMVTRHLTGGTTSDRLAVRTGHLRRSMRVVEPVIKDDKVVSSINFGAKYAGVHIGPRGQVTTIRPKRAKMLAIPLPAAKTQAGVPRGGPRDFPGTFVIRSKAGNLLVVQKGARNRLLPLFVLKPSVRIPARVHPEDIFGVFKDRILRDLKASIEAEL